MKILSIGCVVISKMGRDAGKLYIISKIIDENFVFVCDGKVRTIESPKKKRHKHLRLLDETLPKSKIPLLLNGELKDNEVHRFLLTVNPK